MPLSSADANTAPSAETQNPMLPEERVPKEKITAQQESTTGLESGQSEGKDAQDDVVEKHSDRTSPASDPQADKEDTKRSSVSKKNDADNIVDDALANKKHRRRRAYKLVSKALTRVFENVSSDESETDEESDDDSLDGSGSRKKKSAKGKYAHKKREKEGMPGSEAVMDKPGLFNRSEFWRFADYDFDDEHLRFHFDKKIPGELRIENIQDWDHPSQSTSIFDLTTMYALPKRSQQPKQKHRGTQKVLGVLKFYITIRSETILEAITSLVKFYPGLSAFSKPLIVMEPFCILRHYHTELRLYRDNMVKGPEGNNHEHLSHLLDFLQQRDGEEMDLELSKFEKGLCTFKWFWLLYKPGTILYFWDRVGRSVLRACMVETHSRETDTQNPKNLRPPTVSARDDINNLPPKPLEISAWIVSFNGRVLGRVREKFTIQPFPGERAITSLPCFPKQYLPQDKSVDAKLSTDEALKIRGKRFIEMTQRSFMEYDGESANESRRTISGRVMIDTKYFFDNVAHSRGITFPNFIRSEGQNENLAVNPHGTYHKLHDDFYRAWDDIDISKMEGMSDEHYMLCCHRVHAFVLGTGQWHQIDCSQLSPTKHRHNLINDLVLDQEAKSMIQALSKRFTTGKVDAQPFSADFIRNKGEGQIFLLHGKPGVGKTTTAECVAELTGRPLLSLTCGDLGVGPSQVDEKLKDWLRMATLWDAILLLDEADVYLESRVVQDLQRNSLVSIFLRALEYYQGILFLTTNRVGTFDDGFLSRIHVVIHYPDFTDDKRAQIWDVFFRKLERENENFRVLPSTVDYAKGSSEIKQLGWNGRQIRNAFNTAVALSEFESERDDRGRIMIQRTHLEQVAKMSHAFRDYLHNVQGMDIEKKAKLYKLRDEYGGRS